MFSSVFLLTHQVFSPSTVELKIKNEEKITRKKEYRGKKNVKGRKLSKMAGVRGTRLVFLLLKGDIVDVYVATNQGPVFPRTYIWSSFFKKKKKEQKRDRAAERELCRCPRPLKTNALI